MWCRLRIDDHGVKRSTDTRRRKRVAADYVNLGTDRPVKLLLLILIVVLAYWILRGYKKKLNRRAESTRGAEDMVRCARCGLHLPRSESLQLDQAFYCSLEHRPDHQNVN